MHRRWLGLGRIAAALALSLGCVGTFAVPVSAVTDPAAPAVVVGCLGVDPGANGPQIRVGFVVSGPDGLYRAVLAGPSGPVEGEGTVAGGRGLVIVPSAGVGAYDNLLLTNVDTGQSVDRSRLDDALPLMVSNVAVACDPAALVVPTDVTSTSTSTTTDTTTVPGSAATAAPTPDISALSSPTRPVADSSTKGDAPPWLLLTIPGALLAAGGIVLLVKARSGSRNRPAT